ncbi:MAG: SUMF1/EgtB/PvdO family nonheme iron enzyme [Saprospiraceae bacterium]|nr:SUMF1/EgtB/PvdO family nonheme iron enzyme [Saprospiraceae bacterium]
MKHATAAFLFALLLLAGPARAHSGKTYEQRLHDAELAGDRPQVAAICREWYASGEYSPGILNWNYNALMSVEDNGILFTNNDSDTYPAFLLQFALDVRPDIAILNTQLLENQNYRDLVAQRNHFRWIPAGVSLPEFIDKLVNADPYRINGAVPPTYFGIMSNKDILRADKEKMYLTGLALKCSAKPIDNIAILRFNFENRFRTDYLELPLAPEQEPETVAQINLNYIPALSILHRHYLASGEALKAGRIEALALRIAKAGHRDAEVSALFRPQPAQGPIESAISTKALDKAMKKIKGQLYAAETEVTNSQFDLFLQDLLKYKEFDQLDQCRSPKVDWRAQVPEAFRNLPENVLFANGNPDGPEAPVQNISHAAAQQYCDWITQVYNTSTGKKRFKKVQFRLPTQEEWTLAASGGFNNEPYPWPGGYYVRNSKGCYLCNLNATTPCGGDCAGAKDGGANDGGFFPVPATSYFPNNFVIYNVSGNVAEMLQESGKTMGGSWKDEAYACQIRTVGSYTAASPAIGFRVFMDVIEE